MQDTEYTVRDVLNSSGAVVDTIAYTAYGNIISQTNSSYSGVILYAAYRYYAGANVYLDGQRVYGPADGKFWQQDPLLVGGGLPNFYDYTGDNPTNATDPSGLNPIRTLFDPNAPPYWSDLYPVPRENREKKIQIPQLTIENYKVIKEGIVPKLAPLMRIRNRQYQDPPTVGKAAPSFVWPISWKLTKKAIIGGYVIQHVVVTSDLPGRDADYYEAWEIKEGADSATNPPPPRFDPNAPSDSDHLDVPPKATDKDVELNQVATNIYYIGLGVRFSANDLKQYNDFYQNGGPRDKNWKVTYVGEAWFYQISTENLEALGFREGGDPSAGSLYSISTTKLKLADLQGYNHSNGVPHDLTMEWNAKDHMFENPARKVPH